MSVRCSSFASIAADRGDRTGSRRSSWSRSSSASTSSHNTRLFPLTSRSSSLAVSPCPASDCTRSTWSKYNVSSWNYSIILRGTASPRFRSPCRALATWPSGRWCLSLVDLISESRSSSIVPVAADPDALPIRFRWTALISTIAVVVGVSPGSSIKAYHADGFSNVTSRPSSIRYSSDKSADTSFTCVSIGGESTTTRPMMVCWMETVWVSSYLDGRSHTRFVVVSKWL